MVLLCLPVPSVSAENESDAVGVGVQPTEDRRELSNTEKMAARWVAGSPTTPIERAKALGEPAAEGALVGGVTGGPAGAQAGAVGGLLKGAVNEVKKEASWVMTGEHGNAKNSESAASTHTASTLVGNSTGGRGATLILKDGQRIEATNILPFGIGKSGRVQKIPCEYEHHSIEVDIYDPQVKQIEVLRCHNTANRGTGCWAELSITKASGNTFVVKEARLYGLIKYTYWDTANEKISGDEVDPRDLGIITFE